MMRDALRQWRQMEPFGQARLALALSAGIAIIALRMIAMPALDGARANQAKSGKADQDMAASRSMAAQAISLRALPRSTTESAMARLTQAASAQGSAATLRSANGSAIFTVLKMSPEALASLLSQARQAGAPPEQAELAKAPDGLWSGTISLRLPKENP